MNSCRNPRFVLSLVVFFTLSAVAQAAYTWPTVTPADKGKGRGSSQNVAATLNWNASDTAPHGGGYLVTVVGGYNGKIGGTGTTNIGNLTATFTGTITFDPPLASGQQYRVTFMAPIPNSTNTGSASTQSTSALLTVP